MAEQKPRAPRARKKTETDAVAGEAAAKRPRRAAAAKPATEAGAKKKAATTTPRTRKSTVVAMQPGDVAIRAYLLWEQGEPGDATDHWLRAEHELAAA